MYEALSKDLSMELNVRTPDSAQTISRLSAVRWWRDLFSPSFSYTPHQLCIPSRCIPFSQLSMLTRRLWIYVQRVICGKRSHYPLYALPIIFSSIYDDTRTLSRITHWTVRLTLYTRHTFEHGCQAISTPGILSYPPLTLDLGATVPREKNLLGSLIQWMESFVTVSGDLGQDRVDYQQGTLSGSKFYLLCDIDVKGLNLITH